eukprot:6417034-Karenia_brevis.AAC.1
MVMTIKTALVMMVMTTGMMTRLIIITMMMVTMMMLVVLTTAMHEASAFVNVFVDAKTQGNGIDIMKCISDGLL